MSSPGDNEILLRRAGPSGTLDFVRYIVVILRIYNKVIVSGTGGLNLPAH
jgi:hypothetical protein